MLRNILSAPHIRISLRQRFLDGRLAFSSSSDKPTDGNLNNKHIPIVDYDDPDYLPMLTYPTKLNEELQQKKQRLVYQSRKRGMLENDLLLSTFVAKYLKDMTEEEIKLYDKLINGPTNDWDIYYWATGNKPTPPEYDNSIMNLLKEHVKNSLQEKRIRQPDLY